jgi:hypothetical protein
MPITDEQIHLDTCAVIAAHSAGCWNALAANYDLHTVQECMNELGRGNPRDPKYVPVDQKAVSEIFTSHNPTKKDLVAAQLKSANLAGLDAGEKDLLAWCATQKPNTLLVTTGDRAAVIAACQLGLHDRLRSLEELVNAVGEKPKLPHHFTKAWLAEVKTEYWLEALG